MKPKKKAKAPLISPARARETRLRLALYNRVWEGERTLHDVVVVASAAKKFRQKAWAGFKAAAGVGARERAEAVLNAADTFLKESKAAVPTAMRALDAARDALTEYEERRAKLTGEQSDAALTFLSHLA